MIQMLKEHIYYAQNRYKHFADLKKKNIERQFDIEELVYLKLEPYKQIQWNLENKSKFRPN